MTSPSPARARLGAIFKELKHRLLEQPVDAFMDRGPLDMRIVGRTLVHAMLVGLAAGIAGLLFVWGLNFAEQMLLGRVVGYVPLKAQGEHANVVTTPFRPWLLPVVLMLGGLATGLLTRLAPEARGGGADAAIEAYHSRGGDIPSRVVPIKLLASWMTLGTGGAGGREGPTIQVGAALGSVVSRLLQVGPRERRILLLAGAAAGIAAVFRTPLGAALLITEILYYDGFESEALVPCVLGSVVAYAIVTAAFPEGVLLAHASRYPFVPAHLPLYGALAILTSLGAVFFLSVYKRSRRAFDALAIPTWARPAAGGLALAVVAMLLLLLAAPQLGLETRGLDVLGGGYGLVQAAITGAPWLRTTWNAVLLLAGLFLVKAVATSLTIGSGGSAGDFAPSLAMGGLIGGAFGRAAELLLQDPRLDPGAFVLVGMGAFYGGIANAPLAAMVLVCELAGNYDLLVPLMLAEGIAYVALKRWHLYHAQRPSPGTAAAGARLDGAV